MLDPKYVAFVSGESHPELAKELAQQLGLPLTTKIAHFNDGEMKPTLGEAVRDKKVFILSSLYSLERHSDNIMELILLVDAVRRGSADKIYLVIPYLGYARQDRKDEARTSISISAILRILEMYGVTGFICVDVHSPQIAGMTLLPFDNLFTSYIFLEHIRNHWREYADSVSDTLTTIISSTIAGSPDIGGGGKCRAYAKRLGLGVVIANKTRPEPGKSFVTSVLQETGSLKGKTVIVVDDIVDTGGTLIAASDAFLAAGANKTVTYSTHPVLSGNAVDLLINSSFSKIFITDTIPIRPEVRSNGKFEILGVKNYLSDAIECISVGKSLSDHFVFRDDYKIK